MDPASHSTPQRVLAHASSMRAAAFLFAAAFFFGIFAATASATGYAPYCGDGAVNQAWEQCDGGNSCTAQCQFANQCSNLVAARVNITKLQNFGAGALTSDLLLGSATNKIPASAWFPVYYNGSYFNDPSVSGYMLPTTIAVQRVAGKMLLVVRSSAYQEVTSHVEGFIEFFQGAANGQENVPPLSGQDPATNPDDVEGAFDGVKDNDNAWLDELWLSGGKSFFWITVHYKGNDAFWTTYSNNAPSCKPPPPKPSCTLSANPQSIEEGDSSVLHWTTSNATGISINQGIGSVTPVASGSKSVSPSSTTTYTATVTGEGGTAQCSTKVTVTPPPPPPPSKVTLKAAKIVCDAESDLPNWGGGGPDITANTAADYVALHPGCSLAPNWGFEWATGSEPNPGDNLLSGGSGWTVFGPTAANGFTATTIDVNTLLGGKLWVRERWKSGYIPFSGVWGSDKSAEMYCASDVNYYDNYELIKNPLAGHTYYCVAWNVPVSPPKEPSCTLSADPASFTAPGATTLSWTSTNATSASIDNGIGSVTPAAAGSISANVTTSTIYTMTVSGPDGTAKCKTTVSITPAGLSCTLSVNPSTIDTGGSATLSWTSSGATSGSINNNVGSTSPVSSGSFTVFPPSSTTYVGTFSGPDGTTTCSAPITVRTGPSNCDRGLCPGGLNQPTVSMFRKPGEQPLAFVSLSQIPYTGFEAGPALTMIFWLAVGLLSAMIAYFIVGKGGMRAFLAYILGGVSGVSMQKKSHAEEEAEEGIEYGRSYPIVSEDVGAAREDAGDSAPLGRASELARTAPAATPAVRSYLIGSAGEGAQAAAPVAPPPALSAVLESRAHAAGVLMSPEAASLASTLSGDRETTLRVFADVLAEATRVLPREDGWIMLTADRLRSLSAEQEPPAAGALSESRGAAPSVDESAASTFAGAILSSDRESAFSIVRALEHDGVKPTALMTATATVLDALYRARRDGRPAPDAALSEKAKNVSDEQLARLVETFTHALDHIYASPFTGVKLALAQAFEVVG